VPLRLAKRPAAWAGQFGFGVMGVRRPIPFRAIQCRCQFAAVVADALNTALFAPIACALLTLTTTAEAGGNPLLSMRGHDYHRP
jgi:hypothetical protein